MSKTIVPGILRFVSMLLKYLEKGMSKKIVPGILSLVNMVFKYLKKGMSKKIVLRFVSILFLIFEKGYEQKNCAKICKYSFFNI